MLPRRAGRRRREGLGVSAGDGEAMDLLRRAVADGYHNVNAMAREVALDPLRDRPDFRLLMMDLAMPTDAFGR